MKICYLEQTNVLKDLTKTGYGLRKLSEHCLILSEQVSQFNELFALQILYIFANAILTIVQSMNDTFMVVKHGANAMQIFSMGVSLVVHSVSHISCFRIIHFMDILFM